MVLSYLTYNKCNFSKAKTKVSLSLHDNHYNRYLFVNEKKSKSLKQKAYGSILEAYLINLVLLNLEKRMFSREYLCFFSRLQYY